MPKTNTPAELSLRGKLAVETSWANTENRSARTAPGRQAFESRFLEEAGGDPLRAEHLRKAYYLRLALASAKARRLRAEGNQASQDETLDGGGGNAA